MRSLLWPLLLLPLCAVAPAFARTSPTPATCESAIDNAQAAVRLPSGLLAALALVESGRPDPRTGAIHPWPWTINVDGQGFFFPTKALAISAVRALEASGIHSIDVGCLQVNLMYHPTAFRSLEEAFDPTANARYAAQFLEALHEQSRDWTQAVGDYHSQTPSLGNAYRRLVLGRWRPPAPADKIYGDFTSPDATYGAFQYSNAAYGDFAPPPVHRPIRR
jgi:hypothetical protein